MFQNYLVTAMRNLLRNKLYSIINIAGLAVGLMACMLIMLFVRDEFSFDSFWNDADRIYRLQTTMEFPGREPYVSVKSAGPSKGALENFFSEEIETVGRFLAQTLVVRNDASVYSEKVVWVDPEVADIFSFDVLQGDINAALSDNASIAVSESFALKHFGAGSAIGEILTLTIYDTVRDYQVAAVYKDMPHNSVFDLPVMVPVDEKDFADKPWIYENWFSANTLVYFKLKTGVTIDAINNRLKEFTLTHVQTPESFAPDAKSTDFANLTTLALTDVQLKAVGRGDLKPTGSMITVTVFTAIAGLILLIACINFMNLASAKSTQRAREVALRKVLGAKRSQLVFQFLGESVLVAFIGLLLGMVLAELFLPFYSEFLGRDLHFIYDDGITLAVLVSLMLIVGVLGGAYPALVLSGFLPARVLKANKSAESGGSVKLRSALVVLQFTISIALIACTATVYSQMKYANSMDPGFDKDNMLVVTNIGRQGAKGRQEAFRQEVLRMPGVQSVSLSSDRPSSGSNYNTHVTLPNVGSDQILLGVQWVDHDFLGTYDISLSAGRNYSREFAADGVPTSEGMQVGDIRTGNVVINESAVSRLGLTSAQESIGQVVRMEIGEGDIEAYADLEIVGVVPSVQFQSLRKNVQPFMYILDADNYRNMAVRFDGSAEALVSRIERSWAEMMPLVPFAYEFVDEAMAEEFEQEQATAIMLSAFSVLAVLIACLGLYGVAAFTAERRTKEIGIRKVLGARVRDIVQLLLWQFSKPVLLANVIAWPIAVWGMMRWLENFPYRLDTWVLLPLCFGAGLVALMVAWVTVGGNAAKVARTNPIKALRCE